MESILFRRPRAELRKNRVDKLTIATGSWATWTCLARCVRFVWGFRQLRTNWAKLASKAPNPFDWRMVESYTCASYIVLNNNSHSTTTSCDATQKTFLAGDILPSIMAAKRTSSTRNKITNKFLDKSYSHIESHNFKCLHDVPTTASNAYLKI